MVKKKVEIEGKDCGKEAVDYAYKVTQKIGAEHDMELRGKLEQAFSKTCNPEPTEEEELEE